MALVNVTRFQIEMKQELYRTLFNDFMDQQDYFPIYKSIISAITLAVNLLLILIYYLILYHCKPIHTYYKIILLWNITLPAIQTNFFGIVLQPFLIIPYFVVYNLSFLRKILPDTGVMLPLIISFFLLFAFGLTYAVCYNYVVIHQTSKVIVTTRIKALAVGFLVVFSSVNYYLLYEALNSGDQRLLKEKIYETDKRVALIFEEYNAFVVVLNEYFLYLLLQLSLTSAVLIFVMPYLTYRTIVVIRSRRTDLSSRTLKQQMTIAKMIVFYFMNYTVFVNSPTFYTVFFTFFDFYKFKIIYKPPWAILISTMYMLSPISIGLMYLIVFKFHRKLLIYLKSRFKLNSVHDDAHSSSQREILSRSQRRLTRANAR